MIVQHDLSQGYALKIVYGRVTQSFSRVALKISGTSFLSKVCLRERCLMKIFFVADGAH
jgi:hypothetical protein